MSESIDRRAFGTGIVTAAAAAVAIVKSRDASAQHHDRAAPAVTLLAAPAEKTIVPLPFAANTLTGLSERLLTSHHDNNYATAVRKLNEIRRQLASADPAQSGGYWSLYGSLKSAELAARNSSLLHELYFANLAPNQQVPAPITQMVNQRFGSMDRFQAELRGAAKASNGWVALIVDPTSHTLEIVQTDGHAFGSWSATPLLVLDMFEHAYAIDFGADKNAYFDAFYRNVNWTEVHNRTTAALRA